MVGSGLLVVDAHGREPLPSAPAAPPARVRPSAVSTTTTTAAPGDREAFVVGDSLTVGTEPWLDRALQVRGWDLSGVDARVGRGVDEGLAVLRKEGATLPDTVVIALGTNNPGAGASTVRNWLRSARRIAGKRRVVWVNTCIADKEARPLAASRRLNAALAQYADWYGVELADWCTFAADRDITPRADGVHYDTAGYKIRARFYALALAGKIPQPRSAPVRTAAQQ
ncbi:MAG TPA: GDSL-type esterase/lipase family protein [Acidimicrobiales bacterium]|nr:GDSL-type esterase/lipase family protein [Acidimicrobiales bacterium]